MKNKKKTHYKIFKIILGSFLLGMGIVFANYSRFGADSLSYFWFGMSIRFSITMGLANLIFSVLALLVPLVFDRKQINIGTLLSPLVISLTIDTFLANPPLINNMIFRIIFLVMGFVLYSLGVALYVKQDFGRSTYDAIIMILKDKANISTRLAKTSVDASLFVGALLLGANFLIGPLVFALFAGVLVDFFYNRLSE